MKTVFSTMVITSLRDKISLFYAILFPIGLLIGLGMYFDSPTYQALLLTGVIVLSSLFWGVQGIAFQVHWQRSKGVYKLLKLTPLPTMTFILIMTIARTLIGVLINMLVLFVGMLVFKIDVSFPGIFIGIGIITLGTLCFTCLGYLIANFAQNEAQINMMSNLIQIPMLFGSDAFYSLSHAPNWLVQLGEILPLVYFIDALRVSFGFEDGTIIKSILILLGYTIGLLVAASLTFKWESNTTKIKLKTKKALS